MQAAISSKADLSDVEGLLLELDRVRAGTNTAMAELEQVRAAHAHVYAHFSAFTITSEY